ncbi:MAG: penicillin-binding protein 2 [Candidatus Woykebacteria bacterium RBG_16_43_9]|uniref:Penicillin-binding protein 2 n=1 Tax=Candidatus Woykebacteria bacterium RBG_16_43_9 TaxID=1802596 RepID=A0A1G1WEQ5_9BACT|nr:MAG: penicillin-binding protein 2 [Candidatus Woykebacteria bacterium RBG_16_43_9]
MKKGFPKKFGIAFWERLEFVKRRRNLVTSLELVKATNWGEDPRDEQSKKEDKLKLSNWRMAWVYVVFSALIAILLARAFELQVIRGTIFLGEAQGNHVRVEIDHAPRGVIYDRNGVILAQNKPGFRLFIEPKVVPKEKKEQVLSLLSQILEISEKELEKKMGSDKDQVTLSNNLSSDKALSIEAKAEKLPGAGLEVNPIRDYPFKEVVAPILGYTTEADQKDLARNIEQPYELGDKVGKEGVEATFEETLRGTNGYSLINVSAAGEKKGQFYESASNPGGSVTLSIDIKLQKFVYELLRKKISSLGAKGASAVVLDPNSGEVLALVSLPAYDNNLFSQRLSQREYDKLISNPDKLLLNRPMGAAYPPGSTFKMVTATAGLEEGAISPTSKIVDKGFIILGTQVFQNWLWIDHKKTEGAIDVVRALARSTDTFFYRLGQMIGEKQIEKYALAFRLGSKTGIELSGEVPGLVPNEEWKLSTKGEVWYPGETLNISIGQGDLLVSPLQLSKVTAVFANGGKLITPTILKTNKAKIKKASFLKKETIETVREGLYQDTIGDGNVGWLFGGFKPKSAGKTGTAEAGEKGPHAWYTGYAPYSPRGEAGPKAEIVATVMIEHAGHGSEVAAPVVKDIFSWYFSK